MSYVWLTEFSYRDYLYVQSLLGTKVSGAQEAGLAVSVAVSRQTRKIIASNEALAREHISVSDASSKVDIVTGALEDISLNISELSEATYEGFCLLSDAMHHGFGQVAAQLGHMNDSLSELIKIAKTPVQTTAYNHFEIARDAFRQGLYLECMEELNKAIGGDHTSAGYKLEWRFHQMVGTLSLGFVNCDFSLIDLDQSEQSFLLAARYARADYPMEAGLAFLSAGWAAYCQGKMKDALTHTEEARTVNPDLRGEAYFQEAKIHVAADAVVYGLRKLGQAINLDHLYALKAAGDGDFQKYDDELRAFIEKIRLKKYSKLAAKALQSLKAAEPWLSRGIPEDQEMQGVLDARKVVNDQSLPLYDLMQSQKTILQDLRDLDGCNQQWSRNIFEEHANRARALLKAAEPWLSRGIPEDQSMPCVRAARKISNYKSLPLRELMQLQKTISRKLRALDDHNRRRTNWARALLKAAKSWLFGGIL